MKKILNSVPGFLELVFENRNKAYGAYAIRLNYESRLRNSLLIALIIAASLTLTVIVLNRIAPSVVEILPKIGTDPGHKKVIVTVCPILKYPTDEVELSNHNPVRVVDRTSAKKPYKARVESHPVGTGIADIPQEGQGGDGNGHAGTLKGPDPIILPPAGPISMDLADVYPEFPGGPEKLQAYLKTHLSLPEAAISANASGKVYVQFIVEADGKIHDARLLQGMGFGLDDEALKIIAAMPDWKPGMQAGRPVAVYVRLPIRFSVLH